MEQVELMLTLYLTFEGHIALDDAATVVTLVPGLGFLHTQLVGSQWPMASGDGQGFDLGLLHLEQILSVFTPLPSHLDCSTK